MNFVLWNGMYSYNKMYSKQTGFLMKKLLHNKMTYPTNKTQTWRKYRQHKTSAENGLVDCQSTMTRPQKNNNLSIIFFR